jgi:hypothetical protein
MTTQQATEEPAPSGMEPHLLLRLRLHALTRSLDMAAVELDNLRAALDCAEVAEERARAALAEALRIFTSLPRGE